MIIPKSGIFYFILFSVLCFPKFGEIFQNFNIFFEFKL
jgi:hypothetical protein